MKRIATMQDLSCIGKCSLTVALPVLSAMGIETAVLPTAVLSTHTMFRDFTFHDLTDGIQPILEHWKKEGFSFDALYTGYLGSLRQLDLAAGLFASLGRGKLKIVDPCMADNGKLYTGFTPEFAAAMRGLCAHADIICPNLTFGRAPCAAPWSGKSPSTKGSVSPASLSGNASLSLWRNRTTTDTASILNRRSPFF